METLISFDVPVPMRDVFLYDRHPITQNLSALAMRTHQSDNSKLLGLSVLALKDRCPNPQVIIDVGASVGVFSGLMKLSCGNDQVDIWSYEPSPVLYSYFVRNLQRIPGNARVIPMQLAIWNKTATMCLLRQLTAPEQVSILYKQDATPVSFAMTISLDDALDLAMESGKDVDILKIDVEGAEHVFLPRTSPEKLARVHWILLDTHKITDTACFGAEWAAMYMDFPVFMNQLGFVEIQNDLGVPLWQNTRFHG